MSWPGSGIGGIWFGSNGSALFALKVSQARLLNSLNSRGLKPAFATAIAKPPPPAKSSTLVRSLEGGVDCSTMAGAYRGVGDLVVPGSGFFSYT